ncbi:MAG: hypothetical protein WC632_08215 [Candidatus Margulisiibacteriota bacterium]
MNPSLTQVLAGTTNAAPAVHLNPFFLAVGLVACLAAAMSLAWRRRSRGLSSVIGPAPVLADRGQEEKLEKLAFIVDQLKIDNQQLSLQNTELSGQVQGVNGCLNDLKQTRDVLEKSNLVLSKECEKLRAQKEELVLKASVPLVKAKGRAKPAAPKNSASGGKIIKGVVRKPGRVSRKTK